MARITRARPGPGPSGSETEVQARVKWLDHMSFVGESGSGHSVVIDGSPEHGGRNLAPRPMELILLGLGGCTAYDVVLMLQKSRQRVTAVEVLLDAERADAVPAVFTSVTVHFRVSGHELSEPAVERAVRLSKEKYCSATRMLEPTVEITCTHEILSAG